MIARRLTFASVLCAAVAVSTPAADAGQAFITATPGQGPPGTRVHVEGNCGEPRGGVSVSIGFEINQSSVELGTTTTSGDGAFQAEVTAPQLAPPIVVAGAGEIVGLCDLDPDPTVRVSTPFTLLEGDPGAPLPPAPAPEAVTAGPAFTG